MNEFRRVIGQQEFQRLADNLRALWLRDLETRATSNSLVVLDLASLGVPPSRIESVRDANSGVRYAAWCVGNTLASIAGMDACHALYALFEDAHGVRASSWLDHVWSGISDGIGTWAP